MKNAFISDDGKVFLNENDCKQYEESLKVYNNFKKYEKTYNYKLLISLYNINDYGIWEIRGEDPNPDFSGVHNHPLLGYVEGALKDVIIHAVTLQGFWTWGSGGKITKIEVKKLNEVKKSVD